MRANAFEKLLKLLVEADENKNEMAKANLLTKGRILLSRENDASVLRELLNS